MGLRHDTTREKAAMTFSLLDINRDGVISRTDRDANGTSFQNLFQPGGKQTDVTMEHLGNFWKITIFLFDTPDCTKTFTKDEFVQHRLESYTTDKARTVQELRRSVEHLFKAADVDEKEYFTFEDFRKVHQTFGIDNDTFVKKLFNIAGPDSSGNCAMDDVVGFYTEFMTGEDTAKHALIKEAFSSAGF